MEQKITIRKSTREDIPFIGQHAYRLLEFGPPAWRRQEHELMIKADIRHNTEAILSDNPDIEVFIAEDENDIPCGFLHMCMQTDYYTGERHAHITDIVVIKNAEGKGIGRLLMEKADDWAREKKARWITLNVFEENKHAMAHYEKAGYHKEWTKYLKEL